MTEDSEYDEYVAQDFYRTFVELRPLFWFDAKCLSESLQTFFPGPGQSGLARKAKDICFSCPVQRECFQFAMEEELEYGIWGGSDRNDRSEWWDDVTSIDEAWDQLLAARDVELVERLRAEKDEAQAPHG
jgi:hypothetical protein